MKKLCIFENAFGLSLKAAAAVNKKKRQKEQTALQELSTQDFLCHTCRNVCLYCTDWTLQANSSLPKIDRAFTLD